MATRFMRIDLSDDARDFRPMALEPGVPLLDRSNANARILFRWLGGMVAEPVWEGDSVDFFVRDDHGGRLEEAVCQPATGEDLRRLLKDDVAALRDRIEKAKPDTPTERALKKTVRRCFQELVQGPNRTDLDSYFFRYRDVQGRWRLVWCWGYQRVDQEPAPAVVCTDPECNLLFVRRPGQSPKCPSCEVALTGKPRKKQKRRKTAALLALLLLLLAAGLAYWHLWPRGLVVMPKELAMVVGEITDLKIQSPSDAPVRVTSSDSSLLEITGENRLLAHDEGKLTVEVTQGNQRRTVHVTITAAEFASIAIEPAEVRVPVDDSVRVRVLARIAGDATSREVEIAPDLLTCEQPPSPRYVDFDLATLRLHGVMPTDDGSAQTLTMRLNEHQASAPVEVFLPPFELALMPPGPVDLPHGQQIRLQGWATYSGGRRVQVPSGRLEFESKSTAESKPGLELRGDKVAALKPGAGPLEVYASYFGRKSPPVVFRSVKAGDVTLHLHVDRTRRLTGETGVVTLSGTGPSGEDIDLVPEMADYKSSAPAVVRIDPKTGVFQAVKSGEVTISGNHTASERPATVKLTVHDQGKRPRVVEILSDQDQPVGILVGAEFDDFYVKADYADGITRLVTKKARLWTPDSPEETAVSASNGRLHGIRPGPATVWAEFDGVRCKQPLEVVVTDKVDIDEIQIFPSEITMLPGETLALKVVGLENGRKIGVISGLGNITWQSSDPLVARVDEGPSITGLALGQASVTARFGQIASQPAAVNVVGQIADPLSIDPLALRIHVGESVRIGTDVSVSRGGMDLSGQCLVRPELPNVVRYVPETHSLVGVTPGMSGVAFLCGDKLANLDVEVRGGIKYEDDLEVVVEPSRGTLAPGQALEMRVFLVSKAGDRIDRTNSAVMTSSDPSKLVTLGNRACALAPGEVEVTALLPGTEQTGKAYITVNHEPIVELIVKPPRLTMSTGDRVHLRVLGRAATGTHLLFPPGDLTVTREGPNREAIQITGRTRVDAIQPGNASLTVAWRNAFSDPAPVTLPVTVTDNPLRDLRIDPAEAAIHPGQALHYRVTARRGNRRVVLGPEDGVKLSARNPEVAQVLRGFNVGGTGPGRTAIVAELEGQRAEAGLDVVPGEMVAVGDTIRLPGGGMVLGPRYLVREGWDYVPGSGWIEVLPGTVVRPGPAASPVKLRFVPDVLRLFSDSAPTGVRVIEVLADGFDGRDVTADPKLEITEPPGGVVAVEKTEAGPVFRPIAPGQTRVGARLGKLTADHLLVSVGDVIVLPADSVGLEIRPSQLKLSQDSRAISIRVIETLVDKSERDVTSDPHLKVIQPPGVVGVDKTPTGYSVRPIGQGETEIRARYHGREAVAHVTVAGDVFRHVYLKVDAATGKLLAVEVLTDPSAGPLEYRLYRTGNALTPEWKPAGQPEPGKPWQVELSVPPMQRGPSPEDPLVIKARDSSGTEQEYRIGLHLWSDNRNTDN